MPAKAKMRAKGRLHRAFCNNLKTRRAQLGLTQEDVASALGVRQPAYAVMETGRASPTLKQIEKIAGVLKISPAQLLAASELVVA